MSEGINIEIIGNYKERYPAKIHSFGGDNELIVKFDENPDILCKVPLQIVLLLPDSSNNSKSYDYQVGCDVLVLQKVTDFNRTMSKFNDVKLSSAWWPAKIDKLKGCFAAIEFINQDNEISTDIVELTTLRPMNESRPLLRNDIRIHEMLVPDDLCEFCEHYDIRGDLNRWCGSAIVVNFDKIHKKLQIFSTDQEVVRRASLLDASFMRVLRQKKLIHMQKDELTKRLNDTIKNQYTEEFTVAEELMGLAIGSQGTNIKKAREIEGVINIDLDDRTHTFIISAQTMEACKAARSQLEYMKKIFYVPMDIVSKVIGKNGNQIQDIIDHSGVMRVRVVEGPDLDNWTDEENTSMLVDHVPFIFVGSANSIRDACLLLEFSIDHHREMDRLQKERDEIHREIRNNQVSANVSYKLGNHSVSSDRDEELLNIDPTKGYSSRGRNRGRSNYKNVSNSDIEQRNDSYNSEDTLGGSHQQKYRGNGGRGPYRRGGGNVNFRQESLPPVGNTQHNGNRRYQQFDDDTDEYGSVTNESESGRGTSMGGMKYRGGTKGRGRGRTNQHYTIQNKSPRNVSSLDNEQYNDSVEVEDLSKKF